MVTGFRAAFSDFRKISVIEATIKNFIGRRRQRCPFSLLILLVNICEFVS